MSYVLEDVKTVIKNAQMIAVDVHVILVVLHATIALATLTLMTNLKIAKAILKTDKTSLHVKRFHKNCVNIIFIRSKKPFGFNLKLFNSSIRNERIKKSY